LDGIDPLQGVTVIAATNRPDILDKALLRPGRIDRMLYIAPPDYHSRIQIININLKRTKSHTLKMEQIEQLAQMTEGYTGAELTALCREAAYRALREDIHIEHVEWRHFMWALETVKPRLSAKMIQFYESFAAGKNKP
jgi:SpoVK/Ycf46/Vps4 family AAA+-type ATPase